MPKIITVSGSAQNGKDTFANFAKDYFEKNNETCIIFHYADFLKFICQKYFNWNGQKDEKGRTLLQKTGTEIFRKNNPNCWVEIAKSFVTGLGENFDYVIIPDTRFPNEITCWYSMFPDSMITTVKIVRPNFDNGLTEEQKNHISETALNKWDFDYVLKNDGTLEDFNISVINFLSKKLSITPTYG